jgi:CDP-diacylglycerol pyrophosphatase
LLKLAAALGLISVFGSLKCSAAEHRNALWRVEQTCLVDYKVTGASFPCLKVDLSGGIERGYVVLRPPFGTPDTILSPTKKIAGIEDPSLQAVDAPNYFEDAWNARTFLSDKTARPLGRDDVGLAVNSQYARTQDQLHIHLDCISRDVKKTLQAIQPRLSQSRWVRLSEPIRGQLYWARRIAQESLAGINPFRIVAQGIPSANKNMGRLTIVVVGTVSIEGGGAFILLAAASEFDPPAGDDLLDHSCSM